VLNGRESRTVESDHEVPEGTPLAVEVVTEERDGEFLVTGEGDGSSAGDVSVALTVGYPASTPVGLIGTGNGSLEITSRSG
jgi:hypothetical protein